MQKRMNLEIGCVGQPDECRRIVDYYIVNIRRRRARGSRKYGSNREYLLERFSRRKIPR